MPKVFNPSSKSMPLKAVAPPLLEDHMVSKMIGNRRQQAKPSNDIRMSEIKSNNNNNNNINDINVVGSVESVFKNVTFKTDKSLKTTSPPPCSTTTPSATTQVTNTSFCLSSGGSGDSCSNSNFSGSNSRLSNNSGCSISSEEHDGIWTKLQGRKSDIVSWLN